MAKMMMTALVVIGLAQLASANHFASSCSGVEQIPFSAMEKEDNICHFLVKEGVEQKDTSSLQAYDKIHICACNLWNKAYVWTGLNNRVIRKLNEVIDHRISTFSKDGSLGQAHLSDLLALPKETLQSNLLYLPEHYKGMYKNELPSDEIKKGCMSMFAEFNRLNKFFSNLNKYTGGNDITQSIVSGNSDLKQVVRVFKVCMKANFSN